METKSILALAAIAISAGLTTPAYSGPISGDVSLTGTFSKLPDVGTSSIVSNLEFINIGHGASVDLGSGTGWFADVTGSAAAGNINLDPLQPLHFTYVVHDPSHGVDFTFLATAVSNLVRGTPSCTATTCTDSLSFDISGVVSGPGFFTTAFTGTWTGQGQCAAQDGKCVSAMGGSWNVYLDPPVAAAIPEPGSVALLALGLGVLGLARRRKT